MKILNKNELETKDAEYKSYFNISFFYFLCKDATLGAFYQHVSICLHLKMNLLLVNDYMYDLK